MINEFYVFPFVYVILTNGNAHYFELPAMAIPGFDVEIPEGEDPDNFIRGLEFKWTHDHGGTVYQSGEWKVHEIPVGTYLNALNKDKIEMKDVVNVVVQYVHDEDFK